MSQSDRGIVQLVTPSLSTVVIMLTLQELDIIGSLVVGRTTRHALHTMTGA